MNPERTERVRARARTDIPPKARTDGQRRMGWSSPDTPVGSSAGDLATAKEPRCGMEGENTAEVNRASDAEPGWMKSTAV